MNIRAYKISTNAISNPVGVYEIITSNVRITEDECKDLVIMVGSGVLDKNGTEIFEGDLCKNELGEWGLVVWSDGAFWLVYFDNPSKQHLSDFKKDDEVNSSLLITGIQSFNEYHKEV